MAKTASHSVIIPATPIDCYQAICDFETYTQWQPAVKKVNVWTRHSDNRPKEVEYVVLVLIKQIRYVIDYSYNDEEPSLHWTYIEGDVDDVVGDYLFEDMGDGTTKATYKLKLSFSKFIPRKIMDMMSNQVMKDSVISLKKRVISLKEK